MVDHSAAEQVTYVSADGLKKLQEELAERINVRRPEIAARISDAREMGDLSENFAYHDARDSQAQNESRITELTIMLRNVQVVEEGGGTAIHLGSTFTVAAPTGEKTFTLVGESEADPMAGKISHVSPLGSQFLGKAAGDQVELALPSGTVIYRVIKVH